MDQSRLEELKRPLQKRHQEPKRGLKQNFNGKNFKISNSETKNSEVSNFEVSNSRTLNLEASNFEILNSEPPNFESLNSKALNSATDALNLEGNLETEAAQNSAFENNAEPQNFISDDNGSLQQNYKARDYDKNPIIIKDYAFYDYMKYSTIATLIGCLFFISVVTVVNPIEPKNFRLLPFALVMFFIRRKQQKGVYFVFNDSEIEYRKEDKTYKSLKLEQIGAVAVSFDPRWDRQQRISIPEMLFLSLWPLGAYVMRGMHAMIALISMIAISLFGAGILMHLKNGSFRCLGIHDRLVTYGETGDLRIINVLIYSEKEYLELKEYFMRKTHIDLDSVPRTLSVFSKKVKFRKFKF
ncbi:hypothetical protein [uncultured Campylobacter sp.]|uniref:hypothetical protein n=1 Tax=uncultured Campylobacter sp. TaxID=218934 RepID=UPI00261F2B41|nr:hypothetical protein [uncultured Campylobacter sp.]